jgi:hypothetical protein
VNKRFAAALLFLASPFHAHAVPVIALETATTDFLFGEAFMVRVVVNGVEADDQILAFGFDVTLDTGLIFTSASVGPDFFDDSAFFPTTDVAVQLSRAWPATAFFSPRFSSPPARPPGCSICRSSAIHWISGSPKVSSQNL